MNSLPKIKIIIGLALIVVSFYYILKNQKKSLLTNMMEKYNAKHPLPKINNKEKCSTEQNDKSTVENKTQPKNK